MIRRIFLALLLVVSVPEIEMVPESMKQLTAGFLKVLDTCKTELGLSDGILSDMFRLWKEEYDSLSRDTGCVIACMSKKLDLMDGQGKIHHGNTKEFALNNGADEQVANQLVTIAHECEQKSDQIPDECERALELTKCFRSNVRRVTWEPKMEVVITEAIADV